MKARILLADDHPMIAMAIELMLQGSGFDLVGKAASGAETLRLAAELDPDLVLLDVDMPDGSGIEVLESFRRDRARHKVVLVTAGLSQSQLASILRLRPNGLIAKVSDPADLIHCLETVLTGESWIDPVFRDQLDQAEARVAGMGALTARERELVELVGIGLRNRAIAERLGITEGTVKAYLHAIFDKTGVQSRTELAIRAKDIAPPVPNRNSQGTTSTS